MNNISKTFTSEQRQHMIETAAYYRAQKRGFSDGDPVADWVAAEKEIEAAFHAPDDADAGTQESAAYRRLQAEFKKILSDVQDKIHADTIRQAFDRAGRELKELGEFVPETVDRAAKRLKQEVAAAVEKMESQWDVLSDKSQGLFEIWKDKGGRFVNQAYTALNGWLSRYRERNERGKK